MGDLRVKLESAEQNYDEETLSTNENQGEIVIYQTDDGDTKIDVRFVDETVWLTQQQMAELFQSSRANIVEHIQHIYEEGELDENSNLSEIPTGSNRRQQTGAKSFTC